MNRLDIILVGASAVVVLLGSSLPAQQPSTKDASRIQGDKLFQSGQVSDGMKIEEVWQRVKPAAN
jgi:hypothetical protein